MSPLRQCRRTVQFGLSRPGPPVVGGPARAMAPAMLLAGDRRSGRRGCRAIWDLSRPGPGRWPVGHADSLQPAARPSRQNSRPSGDATRDALVDCRGQARDLPCDGRRSPTSTMTYRQGDGGALTAEHWIRPGWTLELPPTHSVVRHSGRSVGRRATGMAVHRAVDPSRLGRMAPTGCNGRRTDVDPTMQHATMPVGGGVVGRAWSACSTA